MNKAFYSILIVSQLLTSCLPIGKVIYGVKKPKLETVQTLSGFMSKIGLSEEIFYVSKDSSSFLKLINTAQGVPEAEFFDSNGLFIPYKSDDKSDCNAGIDSFIDLITTSKILSTSFDNIESRLEKLVDVQTNNYITLGDLPKGDYYVIFYFSKWSGAKINREHIVPWIHNIKALGTDKYKISYIIVNLDFVPPWGSAFFD